MEEQPASMEKEGTLQRDESQAQASPALTITIQSWTTPLVGLLMLALGLLTGYFGRPLLNPTAVPEPTAAPSPAAASSTPAAGPAQTSPDDLAVRQQALMEAIIPQTIHFKGNPDALVTLVEFSDFQ